MPLYNRQIISFSNAIKNTPLGIVAEHKRRSPSKPEIKLQSRAAAVAQGYEKAGVAAMSVLTNNQYFGGSLEDLLLVRSACNLPLLRKEFIVDAYQIHEAKAYGADAVLLIAACLSAAICTREILHKTLGQDANYTRIKNPLHFGLRYSESTFSC